VAKVWAGSFAVPVFLTFLYAKIWQGGIQWQIQRGAIAPIAPLKPMKVTSFTMILHNSENSIRDIRPFCRQLFCHSSVVKYTSSLLQ